jgi:magnesium chelatase subunit D
MTAVALRTRPVYPFTALVGQDPMKLALVLNAVNPRLGGVLIRGEKGTAKSTAARGLAALLPPLQVVERCRFACDPLPGAERCPECEAREAAGEAPLPARERPAAFVELPLGATEDRVLGTLDLERAIKEGQRYFDPGLLARANRGLLYVDEVNLLPDHLVDALLDAAAMGVNTVEREGVSFSHPAAFVLVGTMNPEEGDLRPQLLDRFGLAVDVAGMPDAPARAEVVRRRIAFEADPVGFARRWEDAERAERARICAARQRLPRVRLDDHLLDLVARICTEFEVDGLRSDIVMYKTAATLAAYAGREHATADDVRRAAELALPHRRRRQPFDQPGLDQDRLDEIVGEHRDRSGEPGDDPEPPRSGGSDGPEPGPDEPPRDGGPGESGAQPEPERVFDIGAVPSLSAPSPGRGPERPPSGAAQANWHARRRAARVESPVGRHVRSIPGHMHGQGAAIRPRPLDLAATLRAAAPYQGHRRAHHGTSGRVWLERRDVRVKVREARLGACTLFVVDASGSMAARSRMAAAKAAVLSLLLEAYQMRDQVGLIAFRRTDAELLLPPTNSADLACARLRDLPTGGRTPLPGALRLAHGLLARRAAGGHGPVAPLLVLVSDGRANVAMGGGDPHEEAVAAARALRASGVAALVVDTEEGPVRLGLARRVCEALGGSYLHLADLPGAVPAGMALHPLAAAVRRIHPSAMRGR